MFVRLHKLTIIHARRCAARLCARRISPRNLAEDSTMWNSRWYLPSVIHRVCVYIYIHTSLLRFSLRFSPSLSLFSSFDSLASFRFWNRFSYSLATSTYNSLPSYPCHIAASSFVFLSISMFTKRLPAPLTCSPSRTLFSCQEKVCKASLDRYTRSDVSLHRYERKRDSGSVYTRREIYICTFLFFPRSTRDRITIVRYTWDCFAGSFLLLGSSWIFNRWSIKEERGRKNVTSSAHRPHCAWRNAKRGQSTPPWQVAARSDINAADHDQLRYVSIIKFRSLHCRRHSSLRRLIWRLYPRFFFFFRLAKEAIQFCDTRRIYRNISRDRIVPGECHLKGKNLVRVAKVTCRWIRTHVGCVRWKFPRVWSQL